MSGLTTKTGFYLGDICYVLDDDVYYGIWGKEGYADGEYEVKDGLGFQVYGTAYGDGYYKDEEGNGYPVDAGVIGLVPLELVSKRSLESAAGCGRVFYGAGEGDLDCSDDGEFMCSIHFDNGRREYVYIPTGDDYIEEDEDDDYDDDYYGDQG